MTLENPTFTEKIIAKLKASKWQIVIWGIVAIVAVGAVLFIWQAISSYVWQRGVNKDKQAISNQLKEIANTEAQIANLKDKRAEQAANVARDTQALLDSANASQAAREDTNRALSNLNAAVNANRSVDATAADLEKRLRELDGQ